MFLNELNFNRIIYVSQIQTKPEMRRNRTRMYNPMRLDALQRWTNVVHLTRPTNYVGDYFTFSNCDLV